jgi:glycosyltransferase involved in cell wall biosynthesis
VKLSIVIPVYNEERHVLDVLRRVAAVPLDKELVVVNDASRDGTSWKRSSAISARCSQAPAAAPRSASSTSR